MTNRDRQKLLDEAHQQLKLATRGIFVFILGVFAIIHYMLNPWQLNFEEESSVAELPKYEAPTPEFENGIHIQTGFKQGENLEIVIANCTNCHSAKMVTQNRATRDGWKAMIKWMQETQNLWELGEYEPLILDYLAKYYAPEKAGRRQPLTNIDWYELEN